MVQTTVPTLLLLRRRDWNGLVRGRHNRLLKNAAEAVAQADEFVSQRLDRLRRVAAGADHIVLDLCGLPLEAVALGHKDHPHLSPILRIPQTADRIGNFQPSAGDRACAVTRAMGDVRRIACRSIRGAVYTRQRPR